MTEAEHNWPNPKFIDNRPSASAAEVFGHISKISIKNAFHFVPLLKRSSTKLIHFLHNHMRIGFDFNDLISGIKEFNCCI